MKRAFLVTVTIMDPYEKSENYQIEAVKVETAIHHAIMRYRKDHMKGRPFLDLRVKAIAANKVNLALK